MIREAQRLLGELSGKTNGLRIGIPLVVLMTLGMVTLPMPSFMLDAFFTFNIALSLLVLLVSVYTLRPLDFAVFPTILLVSTLLRLALNVASTRVVLLNGHTGPDAAGKVIQSFGEVVIGNNYVVGLVVFAILVIINFVVVTKGAGRISEVTARFTLDALPGKQMAIDADLNAGIIDQQKAHDRRESVRREADFYGSMDGASKFVRGDAVAGLLILAINIIGGMLIGTLGHGLSAGEAFTVYSLLTIGDGLVAQIPSLLLSTAAAMMVTRVSESADMGDQVSEQMLSSPKAMMLTGVILIVMGLVPGMPFIPFVGLGALVLLVFWWLNKNSIPAEQDDTREPEEQSSPDTSWSWGDIPPVDTLKIELGFRLITLADEKQGGQLLTQIKGIRKSQSRQLGFLVPSVHIKDNLSLKPDSYTIELKGVTVAEGQVDPGKLLAINPGEVFGELNGTPTKDPAYQLDALWIEPSDRDHASGLGYTVVDPASVMATHLNKIIDEHASELLGHDEVEQLVDKLRHYSPKLADELIPKKISISIFSKVLRELLVEDVPVSDIRTIGSTLLESSENNKETWQLTAEVRVALRRAIVQNLIGHQQTLPAVSNSRKKGKNKDFPLIVSLLFWTQTKNSAQNLIHRLT
ncbi:flagellar biosynthesis protein FlhA [Endozoicomonas sp. GU-1]|uniref:flagellar biosynthesis protein FlhA n=1 Tax=Endozoicomonas sp. GU-1 TaxID=3009078 RepID=UPI0022B59FCA|nr:flagellar biosynthesis protein FlhA [Endozoicomonas sp. GU-1]WBA82544.1 flagellar biosynthesis protein FlhA [Endozoicomonas sp. GU-1]WBA85475.1 flagellar biosynthesis protein FlhA [Endozoicomonas sp. GU-1]